MSNLPVSELPEVEAFYGLWAIIVKECPYCGNMHEHQRIKFTDKKLETDNIKEANCGRGRYKIKMVINNY